MLSPFVFNPVCVQIKLSGIYFDFLAYYYLDFKALLSEVFHLFLRYKTRWFLRFWSLTHRLFQLLLLSCTSHWQSCRCVNSCYSVLFHSVRPKMVRVISFQSELHKYLQPIFYSVVNHIIRSRAAIYTDGSYVTNIRHFSLWSKYECEKCISVMNVKCSAMHTLGSVCGKYINSRVCILVTYFQT